MFRRHRKASYERLLEPRTRVMENALSAYRPALGRENRDFREGQSTQVVKGYCLPLIIRKLSDRIGDDPMQLHGFEDRLRRRLGVFQRETGHHLPTQLIVKVASPLPAKPVAADVRDDPQDPGSEPASVAQRLEAQECGEECFLDGILGLVCVEHSPREG